MRFHERSSRRSRGRLSAAALSLAVLGAVALATPALADEVADVEVKKTARVTPLTVGGQVVFDIIVVNRGPDTARNVVLTDVLPAGLTWDTGTPGATFCTLAGGTLTCTLGDMAPNTHVQMQLKATATECGLILNTATVTADNEPAEFLENNSAAATVEVVGCEELNEPGGCTPGFWKQPHHVDSWTGYATSDTLQGVFGPNAHAGTLLDGLQFGGGSGVDGAKRILLRAAVAALLNARQPGFDYAHTEAEVIAQVTAALGSGNRATMLELASVLDADNNAGCPLG